MPTIYDNIDNSLLPHLLESLKAARRADFSVGYFNLFGWRKIDEAIGDLPGDPKGKCRLLVGMPTRTDDELKELLLEHRQGIDRRESERMRRKLAEAFRDQLQSAIPDNRREAGLRRLAGQLKDGTLRVKLFTAYALHAKLYLLHRDDRQVPKIGYLGSSNLTYAGLEGQGELNIDVTDNLACNVLEEWFENRWNDRWCVDITEDLYEVIDRSWAGEELLSPYDLYLKMAWHLSQEARAGIMEHVLSSQLHNILFEYQERAVKIAAHHINKRGGVLLGDVVGLGKTLMAIAVAKLFETTLGRVVIIAPANLVSMWETYCHEYDVNAKVISIAMTDRELPELGPYRLMIIDESHRFRNPQGKRYKVVREFIAEHGCRCILLSATPYNKAYTDLSAQLRLFVDPDVDLGARPERLIRETGGLRRFMARYNVAPRTLAAFEKSGFADDWHELMRLFMVRRTRSFIQQYYAKEDPATGRHFLPMANGTKAWFPQRRPITTTFPVDETNPADQYAQLYDDRVVETINGLELPRYGLGNYIDEKAALTASTDEQIQLKNLGRAGKRLMGFSRTNLFKRLESSGHAFIQSVERHLLRNYIFLHAIETGNDLPIGTQDADLLDMVADKEEEIPETADQLFEEEAALLAEQTADYQTGQPDVSRPTSSGRMNYRDRAEQIYNEYRLLRRDRFRWISTRFFTSALTKHLRTDCDRLAEILQRIGSWRPEQDAKLEALRQLVCVRHPGEKVLIFSQFADTVDYLTGQLRNRGVREIAGATGGSANPTDLARRFSPLSNGAVGAVAKEDELRVLVATDMLSEGQNLQDARIVVNYDLPWAIIRLIQRAGRVDRIGQTAHEILCYSFLPADGVEKVIRLRDRIIRRLREHRQVIGTDQAYLDPDSEEIDPAEMAREVGNLYNEKAGILDDEQDTETDLASRALEIWEKATAENPVLKTRVQNMPNVVYATRDHVAGPGSPKGVLAFLRTASGYDALVRLNEDGEVVSHSQLEVLEAAACDPETPPRPRRENHHELVAEAITVISAEEAGGSGAGALGGHRSLPRILYERLLNYRESLRNTLFDDTALGTLIDTIYRNPLTDKAREIVRTQIRAGIGDPDLAELLKNLHDEGDLVAPPREDQTGEPRIVCSIGLR